MSLQPRLLIVEDSVDIAEGLQLHLAAAGLPAEIARDGRIALAAVQVAPPDLVVLDLGLPHLDGFDFLARLREADNWCPVLILTARDTEADKLEGFRLGADDYVTKPFAMRELVARVQALLRRAAARSDAARVTAPPRAAGPTDEALASRFGLTARQVEVVRLLAEGLANDEIARTLGISPNTARNHTEHVMRKLGVTARAQVGALLRASAG